MMNIRQRTVNVARVELLKILKANLEVHREEYRQALLDFHTRLLEDLKLAQRKVAKVAAIPETIALELKDFEFNVDFPTSHESDYVDVIEMLEMSVDASINLDAESFKAYVRNEWSWQHSFKNSLANYKVVGSSLRR